MSPHPRILRSVRAAVSHPGSPSIRVQGETYDAWGYLLIPYCKNGTLIDLVLNAHAKKLAIPPLLVKYLARQVLEGMMQLHQHEHLAHRDIKPDNIVIKDDLTLAFIDFAQATKIDRQTHEVCGTE